MRRLTPAVLPEKERAEVLLRQIIPAATGTAAAQAQPVVVFVAGQPGAGKTELADLVQAALGHRGGAVRVCRDLYKPLHRQYTALLAADVRTAGVRVRPDMQRWQAEVEAYTRSARLDVVVETALADPAEFRIVSTGYRDAGYRTELVVLAVAEADSQLGVLQRFFGPSADGGGRYVGWDNQDGCTTGLLETLTVVEEEHLVDRVSVVRRGLKPLYDTGRRKVGSGAGRGGRGPYGAAAPVDRAPIPDVPKGTGAYGGAGP